MAIEARNRTLPDWFTRIRTRQTVLPRFQRFEAWDHARVAQLFNTILRDLPVGAGLVLEVGDEEPFLSRPLRGAPEQGDRVTEHLLDGQQRLTALWRALHNNYDERTYFVRFEPDEETGLPWQVESIARWLNAGDTSPRPVWANHPAEQWKRKLIPLHLFCPDTTSMQAYRDWARAAIPSLDERETLSDQVGQIRQIFATFNLPFMSLPVTTPKQTALDVFIRMNTSAEPLSTYDIVVAQVEAGMGASLHDMVAHIKTACPQISAYYPPEDLVLYGHALIQGRAPTNATYIATDFGAKLLRNWDVFLKGVQRTVDFLEQERVFDAQRLPSDVVVPVLVALWAVAPTALDAEGRARTLLRKYVWRAFFTNRYEKTTNSRALADFVDLKGLVLGTSVREPALFNTDLHPLPEAHELQEAGWPVRKDRMARAILALSLRHGAADLADGAYATRANLRQREYHHLFADAHLQRQGVPEEKIYRALNCALITWKTNRTISDKAPHVYLAQRSEGHPLGDDEVRARLNTHLIPFDALAAGNYEDYIRARAEWVHRAMEEVCGLGGGYKPVREE